MFSFSLENVSCPSVSYRRNFISDCGRVCVEHARGIGLIIFACFVFVLSTKSDCCGMFERDCVGIGRSCAEDNFGAVWTYVIGPAWYSCGFLLDTICGMDNDGCIAEIDGKARFDCWSCIGGKMHAWPWFELVMADGCRWHCTGTKMIGCCGHVPERLGQEYDRR